MTADELRAIRERINKLGVDMQALNQKAIDEKRELTSDEEQKFDTMDSDREKLVNQERRELRLQEISGSAGRRSDPVQPTTQPMPGRSGELRTMDATQAQRDHSTLLQRFFDPRSNRQDYRDAAKRLGLEQYSVGENMYIVLPSRALRNKSDAAMREWEKQFEGRHNLYSVEPRSMAVREIEQRDALTSGVFSPDNTGHYALQPSEMLRALEVALLAYGGMRENATVTRSDTGVPLPFPTMNDTSNEGAIIGETVQETSDVDPPFNQMILHSFTYSSKKVPVSIEFMQDNAINFEARIGEILGTRIARITNRHFTVGTGSGQPTGIVTAATSSGVTTASATAFIYDELVALEHSVDPAYRQYGANGSKWMFNDATLLALKKIKVPHFSGDTQGWPLWRPGLTVAEPDTIDGYQYVVNQHMAGPTSSQKAIIFGALYKYQIRDVRLVEIVRLNELRAEFREVEWFAFYRGDGNLLDAGTHPVKYLTMHS